VDGLINAITPALAVRDTAQARAGAEADTAGDDASFVADDIAEQIAGDDDAVEAAGVLDHDHGSTVNELVVEGELGELFGYDLGEDLAPETAGGKNVGLVKTPDGSRRVARESKVSSEAGDALDLGARIRLRVQSKAFAIILLALTEVDAASQLAHDGEVGAAAYIGLERREVYQRLRGEETGPKVAVRAHLLAQTQETLFRTNVSRAPFRSADGAEQDGVGRLGSLKGVIGKRYAVGVDRALWKQLIHYRVTSIFSSDFYS
jgi:hypothetical protein